MIAQEALYRAPVVFAEGREGPGGVALLTIEPISSHAI